MDSRQFSTKSEAEEILRLYGPLCLGGIIDIPKMAFDALAPQFDETHKMYMLYSGNGLVFNCGLLLNTIAQRGKAGARESFIAEIKDRIPGYQVPWWVS
jgi:hypothetical protein